MASSRGSSWFKKSLVSVFPTRDRKQYKPDHNVDGIKPHYTQTGWTRRRDSNEYDAAEASPNPEQGKTGLDNRPKSIKKRPAPAVPKQEVKESKISETDATPSSEPMNVEPSPEDTVKEITNRRLSDEPKDIKLSSQETSQLTGTGRASKPRDVEPELADIMTERSSSNTKLSQESTGTKEIDSKTTDMKPPLEVTNPTPSHRPTIEQSSSEPKDTEQTPEASDEEAFHESKTKRASVESRPTTNTETSSERKSSAQLSVMPTASKPMDELTEKELMDEGSSFETTDERLHEEPMDAKTITNIKPPLDVTDPAPSTNEPPSSKPTDTEQTPKEAFPKRSSLEPEDAKPHVQPNNTETSPETKSFLQINDTSKPTELANKDLMDKVSETTDEELTGAKAMDMKPPLELTDSAPSTNEPSSSKPTGTEQTPEVSEFLESPHNANSTAFLNPTNAISSADSKDQTSSTPAPTTPATSPELPKRENEEMAVSESSSEYELKARAQIRKINEKCKEIERSISAFQGTSNTQQFLSLDEYLQRYLVNLDKLDIAEYAKLREERREVIKYIYSLIDQLDTTAKKNEEELKAPPPREA